MAAPIATNVHAGVRSCFFCDRQGAAYTCPRCNCTYCSSACYKHSKHIQCSEIFYREWIETHLKHSENSPEDRRRVTDILRRVYQNDEELDSDDDDIPDLHERFSELEIESTVENADIIWDKLTDAEKQEFKNLIDRGDLNEILPLWDPWWRYKEEVKLVKEIGEKSQQNSALLRCPVARDNIPELKQLLSVPVAPSLKYNLINILYAYAYVVRFYNGDHHEFTVESVENILKISGSLCENHNFNDSIEALTTAMHALEQNKEIANSPAFVVEIIAEVKAIVEGPNDKKPTMYILAALTDLETLARNARKSIKKALNSTEPPISDKSKFVKDGVNCKELISKFHHVEKKLVFYMSWIKDHHLELLSIITELGLFHASKLQEMLIFEKQQKAVDSAKKKKDKEDRKIEEL